MCHGILRWLSFSRIEKGAEIYKSVDTGAVIRDVLEGLELAISESQALVRISSLPNVLGNHTMLITVFQNLISNAIKYRKPKQAPVISVSAERHGQGWVFCVEDNGLGIDMAFKDEIFLIFRRLHQKHIYPGSGLGLAIAKKIIEMHHGRVWVESTLNQGSRFYFTLPLAVDDDDPEVK